MPAEMLRFTCLHKLNIVWISYQCAVSFVTLDAVDVMALVSRNPAGITKLSEFIGGPRTCSFSGSSHQFRFLLPSLVDRISTISLYGSTSNAPSSPGGGTKTVNTPMAIYPAAALGRVPPAMTDPPQSLSAFPPGSEAVICRPSE